MKKITVEKAFKELLENSELGKTIEIKEEFLSKEVSIEDVEAFVAELHRNSLILFNKIYDMK